MMRLRAFCAALLLGLIATPSFAADLLYISEYTATGVSRGYNVQVAQQQSADQVTADFTSSAQQSAAFQASTNLVRLWCSAQCSVSFGTNPTATANNMPLAAGVAEYFWVLQGANWKVSVHTNP